MNLDLNPADCGNDMLVNHYSAGLAHFAHLLLYYCSLLNKGHAVRYDKNHLNTSQVNKSHDSLQKLTQSV